MRIFVSYRRSDSQDIAARVVDKLRATPGVKQVFFDVESISPGTNFEDSIQQALDGCDICLFLIGSNWEGESRGDFASRLMDPEDYVRQEATLALTSAKRVVPVLLNNANMPIADALPPEIQDITKLNAAFLRHQSFNQDMELLVDAVFGRQAGSPLQHYFKRHPLLTKAVLSLLGLLTSIICLVVLAIISNSLTGKALNELIGNGLVWVVILAMMLGGAALPLYLTRR